MDSILCCDCGTPIDGATATGALCADCVRLNNDISLGIPREAAMHFCKDCDRWMLPPSSWVIATPESKELLAICLKKLRGLQKVRMVDAHFLWTEPHSRRLKVQITIQEKIQDHILNQSFTVVYMVATQQCPECAKSYTANVWGACVQVRQKVLHKRTFLHMEQLILKHNAHRETINIKEAKEGVDFFFSARNQAEKFVDFLNSVIPVRVKKSQELISEDRHTGSKSYKFTFSVEITPICKDDVVALPIRLAKQMGDMSPLCLCHRVGTSIYLVDPTTLQTADISAAVYWRAPFRCLSDVKELVEFIVMDIEALGSQLGRWALAEATVARASDPSMTAYFTRTHIGSALRPGDSVMGYMITGTNYNNTEFDAIEESSTYGSRVPDVILVKRKLRRKRKRGRNWKLKRMAKDDGEFVAKNAVQDGMDQDYEMFLRDIEEDEELRATVALYKSQQERPPADPDAMSMAETEEDEDEVPQINMDELLDDFDEMTVEDN